MEALRDTRLAAKGFTWRYGIDYEETFAPIARQEIVRMVLSLVAQKSWTVDHLDIKSVFLNGYLDEEVHGQQPQSLRLKKKKTYLHAEKSFVLS